MAGRRRIVEVQVGWWYESLMGREFQLMVEKCSKYQFVMMQIGTKATRRLSRYRKDGKVVCTVPRFT
jgi:hypothetical protein